MPRRILYLLLSAASLTVGVEARQAATPIPAGLVDSYVAASDDARASLVAANPVVLDVSFRTALNLFGYQRRLAGEFDTAVRAYEASIQISRQNKDPRAEASTLISLSSVYGVRGYYDEALATLTKARALVDSFGDPEMIADISNNLGNVYRRRGEPDVALEHLERALAYNEDAGRIAEVARSLNNIGVVYQEQFNLQLALDFYLRSLALKEKVSTPEDIASSLVNIGNIYAMQDDPTPALEYYNRALATFEKKGYLRDTVTALNNLGHLYLNTDRLDEAEAAFSRALALAEQSKMGAEQAQLLNNLGQVAIDRRQFEPARARLEKALRLYDEAGAPIGAAESNAELARLEKIQGHLPEALALITRARETLEAAGKPVSLASVLYKEGDLLVLTGHPDRAIASFERAIELNERTRALAGGTEARVRVFEQRIEPYYALADLYATQSRGADAFRTLERARARGLLDVMAGASADTAFLTPAEVERKKDLDRTMATLTAKLAAQRTRGEGAPANEIEAQLAKVKRSRDEFSLGLDHSHPELKFARGEAPIIDPDQLATRLPKGTALVEFATGPNNSWAFLVMGGSRHEAISVTRLAATSDRISRLSGTLATQLASRDLGFAANARDLYTALLGPLDDRLAAIDHLIVVPNGSLWQVPFQALQTPRKKYLIEERAVSYAPSASALEELLDRRRPMPASPRLVAFGDPAPSNLPNAAREVKELAAYYGPGQSTIATSADATEKKFRELAPSADVLHLATHGFMDDASPLYSHVMLAKAGTGSDGDGRLEGRELLNMRLKADLVVLSACQTARGHVASGEGMLGMSWALFAAGASTAALSLWQVDSASTTELMTAFHRNRQASAKSAAPTAQAMRAAQREILATPEYRHPFYWAGFVVVGVP